MPFVNGMVRICSLGLVSSLKPAAHDTYFVRACTPEIPCKVGTMSIFCRYFQANFGMR